MYRTGHLGLSLLVFAPIGYLFVAAEEPLAALVTGGAMLWLGMLPDVDHRLPWVAHRGATHSLLFAVLVGAAFAAAGVVTADGVIATAGVVMADGVVAGDSVAAGDGVVFANGVERGDRVRLGGFGFGIGVVAVGAHLLGDVLTPAGVTPFWPSRRTVSLSLTRADSVVANWGLFLLGLCAVVVAGVAGVVTVHGGP